jgi:hypothetical protein
MPIYNLPFLGIEKKMYFNIFYLVIPFFPFKMFNDQCLAK